MFLIFTNGMTHRAHSHEQRFPLNRISHFFLSFPPPKRKKKKKRGYIDDITTLINSRLINRIVLSSEIDRDTTWSFTRNKIYLFATTRWINNLSTIFEVEIEIDDLRLELLPFLFSRSCVERTNEIYSRRLNIYSSKMWRRGGKKFWPKVDIILEMKIKSNG